jgi:2,4-dienoyl-CoA reductase-like NADH-dependent reductase (Old Yellow Enzyme family)
MNAAHPIPPARWPTRAEAAASRLFSRITVGKFVARTRTWVPAMVPWRATEDGLVTQDVLDWYGRFADGRPGVLVVEATGIRDIKSGPLLRIGDERFVPGLRRLVEIVRERSRGETRLVIQIIDFLTIRRRPEKARFLREFLALRPAHREALAKISGFDRAARASDAEVREALLELPHETLLALLDERERESLEMGYRERVNDTHLPHIAQLPRALPNLFSSAARRAVEAGFDGVELHFAHAYTMASFLSRTNARTDGYGGSRAARVRLPLEVLDTVRREVAREITVGVRYLGDEVIAGGSRIDDAVFYGVEFARAGADYLSISKGGKFDDARQPKVGEAAYPYTGPSGHECMPTVRIDDARDPEARGPFGRNLPLAAQIRAAVRDAGLETPIVASGGINSFELAEAALARGDCDLIGAARQSLADPDWFLKMELGRGEQIRRCIYTNYCEGLDQAHRQVTCQLWDRDFELPDALDGAAASVAPSSAIRRSEDGKRRLVAPPWARERAPG